MSILRVAILILTPLLDFTKIIYKLSHLLQKLAQPGTASVQAVLQTISEFMICWRR